MTGVQTCALPICDGTFDPAVADRDQRTGHGHDIDYTITGSGMAFLAGFGLRSAPRRPVRYCIDWSEQRHHLAGALGRDLLARFTELDWLRRTDTTRAVRITGQGRAGLRDTFGVHIGPS